MRTMEWKQNSHLEFGQFQTPAVSVRLGFMLILDLKQKSFHSCPCVGERISAGCKNEDIQCVRENECDTCDTCQFINSVNKSTLIRCWFRAEIQWKRVDFTIRVYRGLTSCLMCQQGQTWLWIGDIEAGEAERWQRCPIQLAGKCFIHIQECISLLCCLIIQFGKYVSERERECQKHFKKMSSPGLTFAIFWLNDVVNGTKWHHLLCRLSSYHSSTQH